MKVEKVSATIRYSQDTGHGAWKVIELGAEASVSDREFWKQAQSELYYQLRDQLRTLWPNGSNNGTTAISNGQGGAESRAVPDPPQTPRQHWCQTHNAEFKRRQKDGVLWYADANVNNPNQHQELRTLPEIGIITR